MGRKLANSSNFLRRCTLMDEKPPAIGVVTGPFRARRLRSIDSYTACGMYSPYFSNALAPTRKGSQANFAPVPSTAASRMLTTASVTSGPMPSPAISVTVCVRAEPCDPAAIPSPALSSAGLRCFPGIQQLLQLFLELADVFKVPINTGKANVGHLIDRPQMIHDQLADLVGSAFALRRIHEKGLGFIYDCFQLGRRNGPLLACPQ